MIKGLEYHNIIDNIFDGDVKGLNISEQLKVNCPKCQETDNLPFPDGKYNLEINTNKRVFRCWKCDEPKFSGSLGKLVRIFGSKVDYDLYKSLRPSWGGYSTYNDDEESEIVVSLPPNCVDFNNFNPQNHKHFAAYNYLINDRKLDRKIIFKYNLHFCDEGEYEDRIIVPSYDENGDLNYFSGRTIHKYVKPKYLNPDVNKKRFIFNESNINWDSTVYLVEGVFDMLSFPVNTIPLLGKELMDELYYKLKLYKPNIIILLDPDAFKSTIDIFFMLNSIYGEKSKRIKIIKLNKKDDIDEIRKKEGYDGVIKYLYQARGMIVDDYFIKKLKVNEYKISGRRNFSKQY